ncbi:MAG: hypothetical protein ACREPE_15420 [Lysobacter sp.]
MTFFRSAAVALIGVGLLSGCLSTRSYVDPKLHDLNWSAVKAPAQAHAIGLDVEFFRNGERFARADKGVRGAVERALQKSGVVALQTAGTPARIRVKINNIANIREAMKKGFGTGLTFGAKGTSVTDGYEITIGYEHNGKSLEKTYQHALHTTVGNADPVTPAAPLKPMQAFDQIVEDAVIHFLRDAQSEGVLVLRTPRASRNA